MFYASPEIKNAHVIFFYRNFMAIRPTYCHIGLGVNAIHCVRNLRKNNVRADLFGVVKPLDIIPYLKKNPTCTHAIIQAPWVSIPELENMLNQFPDIHFIIRIHSQIGFLQVEPGAINIIRDSHLLAERSLNLTVSANNQRFQYFWESIYHGQCLYLPNLYDLQKGNFNQWKAPYEKDKLRICSFGALRLMKNHTTAASAALLIAQKLGTDLEFYISVNRDEGGGMSIVTALRNMFRGLKWATLVENPWETWPEFRRTVSNMDLAIQLSMSETFNITTADAAAAGVPSVVGEPVEWVPRDWHAPIDDPEEAARVGLWLLHDKDAGRRGFEAITKYNQEAIRIWMEYLNKNPT
jgi:hypothetical protein